MHPEKSKKAASNKTESSRVNGCAKNVKKINRIEDECLIIVHRKIIVTWT